MPVTWPRSRPRAIIRASVFSSRLIVAPLAFWANRSTLYSSTALGVSWTSSALP
jgi:hypothetical protein